MKLRNFVGCIEVLFALQAIAQFPPQITNVVVIVQENRTPDNLFHFLTPACPIPASATGYQACTPKPVTNACYDVSPCGLSNESGKVLPVTLNPIPLAGSPDISHNHIAYANMCDRDANFNCKNDGAWRNGTKTSSPYGYVDNATVTNYDGSAGHKLDPYLTFAEQYGWANFMYQTNQGSSYPAHQFLFSGTSALTDADDTKSVFVSGNFRLDTSNTDQNAGCSATAPEYNFKISPVTSTIPSGCSSFENKSVQECKVPVTVNANGVNNFCVNHMNLATSVLDPNSISWKYYAPTADSIWTAPNAIQEICQPQLNGTGALVCAGSEWVTNVDVANYGTDVLRDISNCTLSQVSWVIPDGDWSDHAGASQAQGPSWVAAIINAIGNSPACPAGTKDAGQTYWRNTAIVVTWDDWGGWSDNQPANVLSGLPCIPSRPCPGDYQYGFRVPLVVVSAYTPRGFISNIPHDFGSILRMIEGVNRLTEGMMGNADARSSTDLNEFFTLSTPRTYQTVPAAKPASYFLTFTGDVKKPDNDENED